MGNYPIALQTLNRLESSSKFVKFIKGVRVSSHTLESLLIQPIQRLPRYILLLQELCKHTWKQHPDWETLFQALDKMKDVTQVGDARCFASLPVDSLLFCMRAACLASFASISPLFRLSFLLCLLVCSLFLKVCALC